MIYAAIIIFLLLVGDLTLQYYNKWKIKKLSINIKSILENTGFPLVKIINNNREGYMLIDTGANQSYINELYCNQLDINISQEEGTTTGFEGVANKTKIGTFPFKFKNYDMKIKCQILTINGFDMFADYGLAVVGVLGSDFLKEYGFTINYDDLIIYPSAKKLKNDILHK